MNMLEQTTAFNKQPSVDLVGQVFGQLLVLAFDHYADGRYYWLCRCSCGTEKIVYHHHLTKGTTKSCGCYRKQNAKTLRQKSVLVYDGVIIEQAIAKTTQRNNSSGFRGVCKVANRDCWRATIEFKGNRHHLGYFDCFDDAVAARLKGEEIVDDFLAEYYQNIKQADALTPKLKAIFEEQIIAKTKSETDFKRVICKDIDCAMISAHMSVTGDVDTDDPILISGAIKGDVCSAQAVMINGKVDGNITAKTVYIPVGTVHGTITAERVFCSNVARQISGKITANTAPYTRIEQI